MAKCKSYCEEKERHYYTDYERGYLDAQHIPHEGFEYVTISKCNGTKERDECDCGGDPLKCSFYPEERKQANEDLRADSFQTEIANKTELAILKREKVRVLEYVEELEDRIKRIENKIGANDNDRQRSCNSRSTHCFP